MSEPEVKRAKMDSKDRGDMDGTGNMMKEFDEVQKELDGLAESAAAEVLKIEQKYNELRKPFVKKRTTIIDAIPNFWSTAMVNHPVLNALIVDEEYDCLRHITQLEVEDSEDIKSGFKITLSFAENPFFENARIVKEYRMSDGETKSNTTDIKWKADHNLIAKLEPRSVGDEDDDCTNHHRSFFDWLTNNASHSDDEVAEVIRDDLWKNPLQFYLMETFEGDEEDSGSSDDLDADDLLEDENADNGSS